MIEPRPATPAAGDEVVVGGLSGSALASAVIAASSSSLICASASRAFRRASHQSDLFDITSDLPLICLAQRNYMASSAPHRKDQDVQERANKAGRHFPDLAIVLPVINCRNRCRKIERLGAFDQVNAALGKVSRIGEENGMTKSSSR
jgi:hypothetical protein